MKIIKILVAAGFKPAGFPGCHEPLRGKKRCNFDQIVLTARMVRDPQAMRHTEPVEVCHWFVTDKQKGSVQLKLLGLISLHKNNCHSGNKATKN